MSNLYVCDHPLVQSKLAKLRDVSTKSKEFRELVGELSSLICYEATKNLPTKEIVVDGYFGETPCKTLGTDVGVIAILRAGIGMVDGFINLVPNAKVGHIGLYRDPDTLMPVEYFCKIQKDAENMMIYVLDPMLATGGTAAAAIQFLKERGVKNIAFLCLVSSPEGVKKLQEEHPDVDIYTAALDKGLNEKGYVVPGLGDAGDRLFGTK